MNPVYRIFLSFAVLQLTFSGILMAQNPVLNQNSIGSSTVTDTLKSDVLPLDSSVVMTYVFINDPDKLTTFRDSFTWDEIRHNPLRFDQAHLGNYGSPTRSLTPSLSSVIGFSTGWDQYDPYFLRADDFKYYDQNIPVLKVKYSQASQKDTYVTLAFGRSFARGLSLSVSYDRSNQLGEYGHQHQKNTAFGVGVWHNSPSGLYDAFYNYISNSAIGEENGGISAPEFIGDPLYPSADVPVYIKSGLTTHKHRSFITKQIFHLIRDTTSLGIDLWARANISTDLYKYVDEDASMAADYYGPDYVFDERGIRQFTSETESQFSSGITLPWTAARSMIQTSLRYRYIDLNQEPIERKINELYWDASGDFNWLKALQLKGHMSLGLGQADGSFLFRADGILNTDVLGKFSGYWSIMGRKPYLNESTLYVNQQLIYQLNLRNPFTNDVGVEWNWDKQDLSAGINWLVFDNFIYFDTARQPAQLTNSFSLRRFYVNKTFDFKWIGLKGNLIWQPNSVEELAIPDLIYTAGLYGRIKIFGKKVTLMPGIDVAYHDGYHDISYFPVVGRYHLTNGVPIPEYFRVDAALGLKIRFLKIFIRWDDVAGFWNSRVLYQADLYPHYPAYFRIGIEAGFFN